MKDLKDLSGPFDPTLKFSDFSKEMLVKIVDVWQHAWLVQSQEWYEAIQRRVGREIAAECEWETWMRVGERVNPRYPKIANVEPRTVIDCLKLCQLSTDNFIGGLFTNKFEIIDENNVIFTIPRCVALEFFEKNDPERIFNMCYLLEGPCMQRYTCNYNVKIVPLVLPPLPPEKRKPGDIACEWRWTMQSTPQWEPLKLTPPLQHRAYYEKMKKEGHLK